jgi:CheY-like chemotaxis protein
MTQNVIAILFEPLTLICVTQPLALLFYERLLPGTQLVNRLQDLGYRVQTVATADDLPALTSAGLPLLVLADLQAGRGDLWRAFRAIRADPATAHVPILAFYGSEGAALAASAQEAGATLVVQDTALLNHLPQILNRALEVD